MRPWAVLALSTLACTAVSLAWVAVLFSTRPRDHDPVDLAPHYTNDTALPTFVDWWAKLNGTRFVEVLPIEARYIARISRFRALAGHAYVAHGAGAVLRCESQKHYIVPRDPTFLPPLRAPFAGEVVAIDEDGGGRKISLSPVRDGRVVAGVVFVVFHAEPRAGLRVGTRVRAGESVGRHCCTTTWSDWALAFRRGGGERLADVFAHTAAAALRQLGSTVNATAAGQFAVSRAERDRFPAHCTSEREQLPPNTDPNAPADWVQIA